MKLTIEGDTKKIAALVSAVQERRNLIAFSPLVKVSRHINVEDIKRLNSENRPQKPHRPEEPT